MIRQVLPMPKVLSAEQIKQFRENGHLYPFCGIGADEAAALCTDLEAYEKTQGHNATKIITKSHLLFSRAFAFTRRAAILDAVEDLIGPRRWHRWSMIFLSGTTSSWCAKRAT